MEHTGLQALQAFAETVVIKMQQADGRFEPSENIVLRTVDVRLPVLLHIGMLIGKAGLPVIVRVEPHLLVIIGMVAAQLPRAVVFLEIEVQLVFTAALLIDFGKELLGFVSEHIAQIEADGNAEFR